jgi:hypothetical protein
MPTKGRFFTSPTSTPLHTLKTNTFLAQLMELVAPSADPWMILGDFNLTRSPVDKHNDNFSHSEAVLFNDAINELGWLEIPLCDRAYT